MLSSPISTCQGKGTLKDRREPKSFYNHVFSGLALSNRMSPGPAEALTQGAGQ